MKSYAQIQEELLSETPNGYKLQGYFHDHNLSLEEFILLFINKLNREFITVTNNPTVNFDVCGIRKRRSLGDIFLITLHYYPSVTVKEVHETLHNLYTKEKITGIYCTDIKKRVYSSIYHTSNLYAHQQYAYTLPDEWGWKPGMERN